MPERVTLIALVSFILFFSTGCEIRPLDPVTGKAIIEESTSSFDADSYVEENWDAEILPFIDDGAIPLVDVLDALREDRDSAAAQYGYREGSRPYSFIVNGHGKVVDVDTTSRAGTITLALENNLKQVSLQIGPVIRGTALRDALPFITFDQFVNQLEYARVSNAMHNYLMDNVLATSRTHALLNSYIHFAGVFTLQASDDVLITPVSWDVEVSE